MASGVKLDDTLVTFFNDMKTRRNDARLATFTIDKSVIRLDEVFTQAQLDGGGKDGFEAFKEQLTDSQCRYILYDCHFATMESSVKEDLVFVMWCHEKSPVKEKMIYASSKVAFNNLTNGVKHKLEINDNEACSDRAKFAEFLEKNVPQITHVEGVPVCDTA